MKKTQTRRAKKAIKRSRAKRATATTREGPPFTAAYAYFLQRLADQAHETTGILRFKTKAGSFVMMSEGEFESWQETLHLLRSPANASRLLSSIADADAGKLFEHELIEE